MADYQCKVVEFKNMIDYFIKNPSQQSELELLLKTHTNNPKYNIGSIIQNNLDSKYKSPLIGKIVMLINDGHIIGCVISDLEKTGNIYIYNVYIKENFRGKKLSYVLLKKLINSYKNGNTFILDVSKDNTIAIKSYEGIGFKITQTKHFFDKNVKKYYYIMEYKKE